jgi:hypothetical protein
MPKPMVIGSAARVAGAAASTIEVASNAPPHVLRLANVLRLGRLSMVWRSSCLIY